MIHIFKLNSSLFSKADKKLTIFHMISFFVRHSCYRKSFMPIVHSDLYIMIDPTLFFAFVYSLIKNRTNIYTINDINL